MNFKIEDKSKEQIREFLQLLKTDRHFKTASELEIRGEKISGHYSNIAFFWNGRYVMSYVKLEGQFSYSSGTIDLNTKFSNVFYFSMIFPLLFFVFGILKSYWMFSGLGVVLLIGWIVGVKIEERILRKNLNRIELIVS